MGTPRGPKLRCEQVKERTYVLMTAAHNEDAYIEKTIQSVLSQTLLPQRWVIVSDNSSDRTDDIVASYAKRHSFVRLLRVNRTPGHSFHSKVLALHRGAKLLEGASYEYIGNIDADISVDSTYFEELMAHFEQNSALGLTGGFVYEKTNGQFRSRRTNRARDVAHAAQLVRRECYEAIGGYAVLKYGGEDWHAEVSARMKGWVVEAIPKLHIYHHRHTGDGNQLLKDRFRLGRLDYSFGSDPSFEIVKCLLRWREKPCLLAALTRLAGFAWGYLTGQPRAVSEEFAAFLRKEQRSRMLSQLSCIGSTRSAATPWKNAGGL